MTTEKLDIVIMALAFGTGIFISIVDNPLTASFVLIGTMVAWELIKHIPGHKDSSQELHH